MTKTNKLKDEGIREKVAQLQADIMMGHESPIMATVNLIEEILSHILNEIEKKKKKLVIHQKGESNYMYGRGYNSAISKAQKIIKQYLGEEL